MDELQEIAAEKPVGYELEAVGYIHLIFRRLYMIYSEPREQPPLDNDVSLQRRMTAYTLPPFRNKPFPPCWRGTICSLARKPARAKPQALLCPCCIACPNRPPRQPKARPGPSAP